MVPIGNNLSSLLLVTFSKYSSWLIYILFYFFKLIKKSQHGFRIQKMSVMLMWVGLKHLDRLLVDMILHTKKILRFHFLLHYCLWLVFFEQ